MNEQLKIIISAEINKLKETVGSAKKEIESLKQNSKVSSQQIDENFKKMGESSKAAFNKLAVGAAAAGTALLALGASTTEYRQNQAQLNAAFEQANLSTKSATGAYKELYKVIGDDDQAVESAANIAMLASSEQDVAKWSGLAAGVLGTFHDTLQPEAFYEAANETLKLGEATGAFTQMLEQTGVMSVDAFNQKLAECSTEQEKQAFMLEVSQKAMGGAAESYNKATAEIQKQREAQANLNATLATLGEAVAPIITAFISFANDALAAVVPFIQEIAEKHGPTLNSVLSVCADIVGGIVSLIADNIGIVATIAGIIAGISAAIGLYNTVAAVKAAMDAAQVTTLGALVAGYMAQAAAMAVAIAPYALIVAAIAGVIAIIVVAIKNWDAIKAKVIDVATSIKNKVIDMKNSVVGKFEEIRSRISSKVESVKSKVTTTFNAVKNAIMKPVNSAKDAVKSAIDKIKGFFNFSWSLPKLKLPKINITGKFSLAPPSVPKFSISWNRLGGIFDKPTLFSYGNSLQGLGEDGAEAVVPLEKNTQWLDKLADRLAAKQNGIPIVLQVDGKTFAQVSIDSINALTKQRGTLGLNLV